MRIYWYTSPAQDASAQERERLLRDILGRTGMQIIERGQSVEDAFPDTFQELVRRGESFLEYVDAIIVEGGSADPEVGYLLAYAVAQKKPALLLLQKGKTHHNPLATFGKKIPRNLRMIYYDKANIEKITLDFLGGLGDIPYREVPAIKFTLRITPKIEEYLHWKTHNTKMTKADFLRKAILEDLMIHDKDFQDFLAKRRRP